VECPIDEMNRPRGRRVARLRIPPTAEQDSIGHSTAADQSGPCGGPRRRQG
jgi:hypothetical protein